MNNLLDKVAYFVYHRLVIFILVFVGVGVTGYFLDKPWLTLGSTGILLVASVIVSARTGAIIEHGEKEGKTPYKLSTKGKQTYPWKDEGLTDLQEKAMDYALTHHKSWFFSADVAQEKGYKNGQYFRGVLSSLHKKGLLLKGD